METVITRFAPSPTGYLHIGGARTALFNWLYARNRNGKFILRIENTDLQRSTKESTEAIFEGLTWLGIDWDEGPYFQTDRFDLYKEYAQKLFDAGRAYYCRCTPEELEAKRKISLERDGKVKYDGTCRGKELSPGDDTVLRFAADPSGNTPLNDKVKGGIIFNNEDIDDFIILRRDGTPTYNFAVVIDDVTMNVNTVIRGDDHVSNTPKQIQIYKALGAAVPAFAHAPMVLGKDKSRLSKRHGAMSVTAYREMGYLPEALINYLVRLGWSYGDQEFFTRGDLIEKFSLEHIGRSAGVFDPDKLLALNGEHIRSTPVSELAERLIPFLEKRGIHETPGPYLEKAVETLVQRSKTLEEMAESAVFYFSDTVAYDEKAAAKCLKPDAAEPVRVLIERLEDMEDFDEKSLEDAFKDVMEKTGLKLGKIAQPVRVALTGRTASPGIFEIVGILGKDKVIRRLSDALEFIESSS